MPRRRGRERFRNAKQAAAELARLRAKYPNLYAMTDDVDLPRAFATVVAASAVFTADDGFPCRAHGVPWKQCTACSTPRGRIR